ncbi:hypothetical protein [Pseudoalteromonas fuliginea]|uniref:hypothetical protein n=1 Tax=Pseudoalteromonas fuliginea TaxID=1872678 RepID=UPI0021D2A4D6|nr:hypothetical protein [Pseudoalteromonas fuliginea]
MVGGTIIGGLVGGLFKGGNDAYQYNLYAANEGEFIVIQKQKLNKSTQYVTATAGDKVKLKLVDYRPCTKRKQKDLAVI